MPSNHSTGTAEAAACSHTGVYPESTGYSVQVELADPDTLKPGRHYTPMGMYTYAQLVRSRWSISLAAPFTGPITRDPVEAVLRRVSATNVRVTALTDRVYQTTDYRRPRVARRQRRAYPFTVGRG